MGLSLDWRCCFAALALRHNRPGTGAYQLPAEANPSALGFGTVGYNSYCVFIGIVYVFVGIALLLQTSDQNVEFPSVSITTSVAPALKNYYVLQVPRVFLFQKFQRTLLANSGSRRGFVSTTAVRRGNGKKVTLLNAYCVLCRAPLYNIAVASTGLQAPGLVFTSVGSFESAR